MSKYQRCFGDKLDNIKNRMAKQSGLNHLNHLNDLNDICFSLNLTPQKKSFFLWSQEIYPPENRALADKIRNGNGAIVSEFSMQIQPDRQTFPMRNRIISGWSHGILVVEAGLNSGALITVTQALEQGRSVYAVPGQINSPTAQGSNRLIQQGAKLVMSASDNKQ